MIFSVKKKLVICGDGREAQMDCIGLGTEVGQVLSHTRCLPTRLHWRPWAEP